MREESAERSHGRDSFTRTETYKECVDNDGHRTHTRVHRSDSDAVCSPASVNLAADWNQQQQG
eukprot:6185359-Pleurochrysis_carterae.AAC.1